MARQMMLVSPPPAAAAPSSTYWHLAETDETRRAAGFFNTDQKHAKMGCPSGDAMHKPILFRAQSGINAGKLFWKCLDCKDRSGKLGKLLGLDAELEETGLTAMDEMKSGVPEPPCDWTCCVLVVEVDDDEDSD